MGAGFLSLRVKIPAFWLGGRRNPQKVSIRKMQRDTVTQTALYTALGRTCSCGLPLRKGILPLSMLALLVILGPIFNKILFKLEALYKLKMAKYSGLLWETRSAG
jgi:hypothetical protein